MDNNKSTSDLSNSKITVKCDACPFESTFSNEKEAYLAGWAFKPVAIGLNICFCPACAPESV